MLKCFLITFFCYIFRKLLLICVISREGATEQSGPVQCSGANGYLDQLPVETLGDYEQELYNYIESNDPSIYADLKEKQEFDDDVKEKLDKVLTSFGDTFKATKGLN